MKNNRANRWHAVEAEEAVRLLGSSEGAGLSPREAAARRRKAGANQLWQISRASVSHTLLGEFLDFAAILLVITAAVAAVFERGEEAAAICVLLVFSALFRTVTSVIAQRIFENAARENIPRASVIRGGRLFEVPADEVVPGDIVLLSAGDTAVCDMRLVSGEVDVLESALTDTRSVRHKSAAHILPEKTVCAGRSNIVFAASSVVAGSARGIAVACGEYTYAYARGGYIPVHADGKIGVIERLCGWCRNVSLCMTAAVLVITLFGLFLGDSSVSLDSLFLSALALAVASMSEFLSVIASIVLACSVRMLAAATNGASVIKNVSAIEHLAETKCVVFTTEKLLLSDNLSVGSWYIDGQVQSAPDGDRTDSRLQYLLRMCAACAGSGALSSSDGGDGSNEILQICERFSAHGGASSALSVPLCIMARAYSSRLHTVLAHQNGGVRAYICGELSDVLACCSNVLTDGIPQPMTPDARAALLSEAARCESRYVKTVALAVRSSPYNNLAKLSAVQTKMALVGYFTVLNPVEVSLARYIDRCRAGGIRLVLCSDSASRAGYLASEASFFGGEERILKNLSPQEAADKIAEGGDGTVVCFRGSAEKSALVRELRERLGEVVCVGEAVEDIPVFSEASVKVAAFPGISRHAQCVARRADALAGRAPAFDERNNTRTASALEALRIVGYCRSALCNLRGAAEYLLISQLIRMTLMFAAVALGVPLISSVRILVWGLVLDYAAVLCLAFRRPQLSVLDLPQERLSLPAPGNGILFPVISGILCGVLLAAVPVLHGALGFVIDRGAAEYFLYAGGLLSSFAAVSECLRGGSRRVGFRIHAAYLACMLLFAAALAAGAFRAPLTADIPTLCFALLALLPAVILAVIFRVYQHTDNSFRTK